MIRTVHTKKFHPSVCLFIVGCFAASTFAAAAGGYAGRARAAKQRGNELGLYVRNGTTLAVYPASDPGNLGPTCYVPLAQNSDFGQQISVDRHGHLWVPEYGGTIVEYGQRCGPSGRATVLNTLLDQYANSGGPTAVITDSKGKVYVENAVGFGNTGNVAAYRSGAIFPYAVLYPAQPSDISGIAVDAGDNLYMARSNYQSTSIDEIPKGKRRAITLNLTGIACGTDIAFDAAQNMLVLDRCNTDIAIFAPPYSGSPTSTLILQTDYFWESLALDSAHQNIYVASDDENGVQVYTYPAGTYQYTVTTGLSLGFSGVALDPAASN